MFMRYYLYALSFFILLSCSCVITAPKPPPVPDKELKEVIIYGDYYPKEEYKLNSLDYSPDLASQPFNYFDDLYCYNETKEKKPVYDESLRVRLYDKEGNMLAEDFLRAEIEYDEADSSQHVISYLPYMKIEDAEIRIVKLEEGKEKLIKTGYCCSSHKEMFEGAFAIEFYRKNKMYTPQFGWTYSEKSECYSFGSIELTPEELEFSL